LFVDDLVNAFLLAWKNIDRFKGEAFNMGGGPENSLSLLELLKILEDLLGRSVQTTSGDWRSGDQKYYISDTSKFRNATGWKPTISAKEGVKKLYNWLNNFYGLGAKSNSEIHELRK
jgi:CDP-paratose 2-epimerase